MVEPTDNDDPSGISFGPTFVELLILALIDGHEVDGRTRRQRLDAAMKAITGQKSTPNAFANEKDDLACVFMGAEHHRDKCAQTDYDIRVRLGKNVSDLRPKLRSARKFAKLAEEEYFKSTDVGGKDAIVNRLRETFTGVYQKKLKHGAQADYKNTFVYRAVQHDYLQESFEKQDLEKIIEILRKYGVAHKN